MSYPRQKATANVLAPKDQLPAVFEQWSCLTNRY